jgi:hypothetical protein
MNPDAPGELVTLKLVVSVTVTLVTFSRVELAPRFSTAIVSVVFVCPASGTNPNWTRPGRAFTSGGVALPLSETVVVTTVPPGVSPINSI